MVISLRWVESALSTLRWKTIERDPRGSTLTIEQYKELTDAEHGTMLNVKVAENQRS